MRRLGILRRQPAKVNDATHALLRRRLGEITRGARVEFGERLARGHRVHEIVGDVHAGQRCFERVRLQRVGRADLHALPVAPFEDFARARRRAYAPPGSKQVLDEIRADVTAGAEDEAEFVRLAH